MNAVSVDLASRNYDDIGIAILNGGKGGIDVHFCRAQEMGLEGQPNGTDLAGKLDALCNDNGVRTLIIDGPQAWKDPNNGLKYCRLCESALKTPGKTGLPGQVLPRSWTSFVQFSISVFEELQNLEWGLLNGGNLMAGVTGRMTLESFPTSAWRCLGIDHLPGKRRATVQDLINRRERLVSDFSFYFAREPNHDELQASVAGLGALAFSMSLREGFTAVGADLRNVDGMLREGYIVNPRPWVG